MKLYRVKVNGKVYEVELEAVEEKGGHIEAARETVKPQESQMAGGKEVTAPIAGKVTDIKVSIGDTVREGQTVLVIEAMKLENEIQSVYSGKVAEIRVKPGDDVRNKDVLIVLQ